MSGKVSSKEEVKVGKEGWQGRLAGKVSREEG